MTLYLCAHLVNGQPTFDIAEEMEIDCNSDPGPWYITSAGHRIRPYWTIPITHLEVSPRYPTIHNPLDAAGPPPDDAEDSWTAIKEARDDRGILALIGLAPKPTEPLRRL